MKLEPSALTVFILFPKEIENTSRDHFTLWLELSFYIIKVTIVQHIKLCYYIIHKGKCLMLLAHLKWS